MERRSAHRSTPRKKYTVDAFEGIEDLIQDARSDHSSPIGGGDIDDGTEEEFQTPADAASDIDDDESGSEGMPEEEDPASDAGELYLDNTHSVLAPPHAQTQARPGIRIKSTIFHTGPRKKKPPRPPPPGPKLYTRGAGDQKLGGTNPRERLRLCYGDDVREHAPALRARERWAGWPSFPSRRVDAEGRGGMGGSSYVDQEVVEKAMVEERRAWEEVGGLEGSFGTRKEVEVTEEEARGSMPGVENERAFVMGPVNEQKLYRLAVGDSMPLTDAWNQNETKGLTSINNHDDTYKSGFILNLGARVHCLDWAPHERGPYYHLALSLLPDRDPSKPPTSSPAFTPQAATPSSIQIWSFKARENGTIDTEAGCKLNLVLCTSWGDIRELKFCPMLKSEDADADAHRLGLLATLSGDGAVRVLRIKKISPDSPTRYAKVEEAAFSSRPPDTVCTSLTWLSTTRLAAGCANGFICIWDLPTSLTSTSPGNPRPVIYTSISSSYILSIASCYPSRPHFLLTTSMAGYMTLTDTRRTGVPLGSPSATVFGSRSRISQRGLAWHDYLQFVLQPEDNFMLKGSPMRRIFTSMALGRAKSNVTALAVSPCHPSILVGSASGEVFGTNPLKRALDRKPSVEQQVWFAHEWRRPTGEEAAAAEPGGEEDAASIGRNGLSRISEGFKIERNIMAREDRNLYNTHNGVLFATVYEEKSAVTALAWNPNVAVGGWAAAGMADGLLRLEDIAV